MLQLHVADPSTCGAPQAEAVLCEHAYRDHKMSCIDNGGPGGSCKKCGFGKKCWSTGLRRELVTPAGDLRRGVHPVWLTEMEWSKYQSSKTDDKGEREDLHKDCSGSIVDFLDELEGVYKKYTYHRYTVKHMPARCACFCINVGTLCVLIYHC